MRGGSRVAAATTTTSSSSASSQLPPVLLLLVLLAAHLLLSSGEEALAAEPPLKDVSLQNPKVNFVPPSLGGQFCERVHISGVSRSSLKSYSSQIRVRLNVSESMPERFHWKIEVCFHRNVSMGLCQCELDGWQVFQNGHWSAIKSPYENRYLDVKVNGRKSTTFTISIQEEFQQWRLTCLGIGFLLLLLAPIVSNWVPFYYSSSMALGVVLVVLIILFQGMKLLPMGRKSFLYLTIYGSVLGVGSYLVHYFSTLVSSILENFGLSEEMYNPVSVFLLTATVLTGAGFGYWLVRKFVLSRDGSVDAGIAQFVKWAMRVVALFFVMQSTLDPLLALVAVIASWCIYSLMRRKFRNPATLKHKPSSNIWQSKGNQVSPNYRQAQFLSPSTKKYVGSAASGSSVKPYSLISLPNKGRVSSALRRRAPNQDGDYYSTFHKIQPRKFTMKEWDDFTQESTREALIQCASTPEFAKWVADNAHRLRVEQEDTSDDTTESSSDSSEETAEEINYRPGLFRWY